MMYIVHRASNINTKKPTSFCAAFFFALLFLSVLFILFEEVKTSTALNSCKIMKCIFSSSLIFQHIQSSSTCISVFVIRNHIGFLAARFGSDSNLRCLWTIKNHCSTYMLVVDQRMRAHLTRAPQRQSEFWVHLVLCVRHIQSFISLFHSEREHTIIRPNLIERNARVYHLRI